MPYLSKKSGKTLNLLKQSSKKIQTGKKRKKHEILGSLQDWQGSQPNSQPNSQQPMVQTSMFRGST